MLHFCSVLWCNNKVFSYIVLKCKVFRCLILCSLLVFECMVMLPEWNWVLLNINPRSSNGCNNVWFIFQDTSRQRSGKRIQHSISQIICMFFLINLSLSSRGTTDHEKFLFSYKQYGTVQEEFCPKTTRLKAVLIYLMKRLLSKYLSSDIEFFLSKHHWEGVIFRE